MFPPKLRSSMSIVALISVLAGAFQVEAAQRRLERLLVQLRFAFLILLLCIFFTHRLLYLIAFS